MYWPQGSRTPALYTSTPTRSSYVETHPDSGPTRWFVPLPRWARGPLSVPQDWGTPSLLCLGKGLVVILNYIQTAGPLRSGVLFSQQRSGPFHSWEGSRDTTCPGRGRNSCASSRGSGPPKETGPPRGPGPLMGSWTPCIVTGPLTEGRNRHPVSGWSGDATCLQIWPFGFPY